MSAVEKFPILLSDAEEESSAVPPCFSDEGINVNPRVYPVHIARPDHHLVPLHSSQQSLPPSPYETQHKCCRDPPVPPQNCRSIYGILQSSGRRIHP